MTTSAVFGTRVPLPAVCPTQQLPVGSFGRKCGGSVIECSSRPKKKATSHHMKTRPRKTQPWDIKRKPTVYPPLPPLPPDWTLVSEGAPAEPAGIAVGDAAAPPPSS